MINYIGTRMRKLEKKTLWYSGCPGQLRSDKLHQAFRRSPGCDSEKADYASSAFLLKKLKIMLVLPNYAQNYAGTIESSLAVVGVECSEMRLETRLKYVWEVEEKGKTGI